MVAPVEGPIVVDDHRRHQGPGSVFCTKVIYRQAKPYTLPLKYKLTRAIVLSGTRTDPRQPWPFDFSATNDSAGLGCVCSGTMPAAFDAIVDQSIFLAREKFMATMHEKALLAVNVAERVQAAHMMSTRIADIADLLKMVIDMAAGKPAAWARARKVLKGMSPKELKKYLKELKTRWREAILSPADLWLELHFGWVPMVQDVHNAIAILDSPVPNGRITVRSRSVDHSYTVGRTWSDREYSRAVYRGSARATVFGEFSVSNLNAYRAQRMGITNPYALAWELVPFSFIVDWFTTVGAWIAQWDETLGIKLLNAGYSYKVLVDCDGVRASYGPGWECVWTAKSSAVYFTRNPGNPGVKLGMRPSARLSLARGATAIALLVQRFEKAKVI